MKDASGNAQERCKSEIADTSLNVIYPVIDKSVDADKNARPDYIDSQIYGNYYTSSSYGGKVTGNSGVTGKVVRSSIEGTADAVIAKTIIDKLPNTTKSVTRIPPLGVAAEVETVTANAGVKAIKGATKTAGPIAIASYGYDVYQDVKKYDGVDAAKAVTVTTFGTGVTIAAGVACTGVGAPVGAAIAVGVVVGVVVGIVGDKVKEWWIGHKEGETKK